jgi:dihydrofolate reductase
MILSLIVAMTPARVIGRNNQIPWHLPRDLRFFRRTTLGKPIIMGRKTFESIGRPLPKRTNIVLTRQLDYSAPGILVAHTLSEATSLAQSHLGDAAEAVVIGGTAVYEAFLPQADRIYLTLVEADLAGDTFFPPLDLAMWRECGREHHLADEKNPYQHTFFIYERPIAKQKRGDS